MVLLSTPQCSGVASRNALLGGSDGELRPNRVSTQWRNSTWVWICVEKLGGARHSGLAFR